MRPLESLYNGLPIIIIFARSAKTISVQVSFFWAQCWICIFCDLYWPGSHLFKILVDLAPEISELNLKIIYYRI